MYLSPLPLPRLLKNCLHSRKCPSFYRNLDPRSLFEPPAPFILILKFWWSLRLFTTPIVYFRLESMSSVFYLVPTCWSCAICMVAGVIHRFYKENSFLIERRKKFTFSCLIIGPRNHHFPFFRGPPDYFDTPTPSNY